MTPRIYYVYGFEGRGGKYLVTDTMSASEARDLRHARTVSGFPTIVTTSDGDISLEDLDRIADIEERLRYR